MEGLKLLLILFLLVGLPLIILNRKKDKQMEVPDLESKNIDNQDIIYIYRKMKEAAPSFNEPNYELARKVFLDFNDFNLKNNENGLHIYLDYVPKSLLPYPKNYIKCAYYIFLEKLRKENKIEMFNNVQNVGCSLFYNYPDYKKYKENLKSKKWLDSNLKDLNMREAFKKLYGVYEVSEEDYNSSSSSIDATNEELIYDFGVLLKIEKDVELDKIIKKQNTKNMQRLMTNKEIDKALDEPAEEPEDNEMEEAIVTFRLPTIDKGRVKLPPKSKKNINK